VRRCLRISGRFAPEVVGRLTRRRVCSKCYSIASTFRRSRLRIDLHSSCHARHQSDTVRYLIDVDAHRHALRKSHPSEDRIYRGETRLIWLSVWQVNAASNAVDVATDQFAVTH
jgi:hypothetical protein